MTAFNLCCSSQLRQRIRLCLNLDFLVASLLTGKPISLTKARPLSETHSSASEWDPSVSVGKRWWQRYPPFPWTVSVGERCHLNCYRAVLPLRWLQLLWGRVRTPSFPPPLYSPPFPCVLNLTLGIHLESSWLTSILRTKFSHYN